MAPPIHGSELLSRLRLHPLVYSGDTTSEVLIALAANNEARVEDEVAELVLGGEPLDAFDKVLVRVPVAGDELADEGDGAEAPAPVGLGEERGPAVGLAELEDGEDAAGLQHAVRLAQRRGDVAKVADAKGHRVQVDAGVRDARGGQVLGVGLEEGEVCLLACGEGLGPLLAHCQHVWVDVGDGHAHVRVAVHDVGMIQVAEGDVACAAGYVEDVLGWGVRWVGGEAWVEGGYVVIFPDAMPAEGHQVVHAVVGLCDTAEYIGHALSLLSLGDGLVAKMGLTVGCITRGCISGGRGRGEGSG